MVCLGNICRSPLAEGILQQLAGRHQLDWQADSAGTHAYSAGSPPDHRSIAVAAVHGIDISRHRCRRFTVEDFDRFDKIYAMDKANLHDIRRLARSNEEKNKVQLFLGSADVPDPFLGEADFDTVYRMIAQRCNELIREGKEAR